MIYDVGNMAVPDGQTTWMLFDRRSLRPPFANAHRSHFVAVGKGLPSLTDVAEYAELKERQIFQFF